jgi:hypothetical protein
MEIERAGSTAGADCDLPANAALGKDSDNGLQLSA